MGPDNKMMEGAEEERRASTDGGGILMDFVERAHIGFPHISEMLVSLLDVRDLRTLRLVSRKTRDWVDETMMSKHHNKAFTLCVDRNTALEELVAEETARDGILFFRRLDIRYSPFYLSPIIPSFLRTYGDQIHTVYRADCDDDVLPEEVAFIQALPNLVELHTSWLGPNAPNVKMRALKHLHLYRRQFQSSDDSREWGAEVDLGYLHNFPNLTHLGLPYALGLWDEDVHLLSAVGDYLEGRRKGSSSASGRTLTICLGWYFEVYRHIEELNPAERQKVATLLQELALADGRIGIENLPVQLLDEAVRVFHHQEGGQKKLLRSFGKSIRSLGAFSSSLYEVELPNLRSFGACLATQGTARDGDFSKILHWPKLEEICVRSSVSRYMKKLLLGSGVRPSVKRLEFDLDILFLRSNEAIRLLMIFPNLTDLTLNFGGARDVGIFRSVMQVLPTSCPKIEFISLSVGFSLGHEDYFRVDGEVGEGLNPPLMKFPALKWLRIRCSSPHLSKLSRDKDKAAFIKVKVLSLMQSGHLNWTDVSNDCLLMDMEKSYAAEWMKGRSFILTGDWNNGEYRQLEAKELAGGALRIILLTHPSSSSGEVETFFSCPCSCSA